VLGAEPTLSAKCRFADVVADLAILEEPEDDEAEAFADFIAAPSLVFTTSPVHPLAPLSMLNLDNKWVKYAPDAIESGMSGSPIVALHSVRAVGVISTSSAGGPWLPDDLPAWWVLPK
jgi:hypothetical protein